MRRHQSPLRCHKMSRLRRKEFSLQMLLAGYINGLRVARVEEENVAAEKRRRQKKTAAKRLMTTMRANMKSCALIIFTGHASIQKAS
jgi:hypothetical protein